MGNKVYCQVCGRQIVDFKADNKTCIGPASDGCLYLGPSKYACPKCKPDEIIWGEIQEEAIAIKDDYYRERRRNNEW
jgi:hypothetical protein